MSTASQKPAAGDSFRVAAQLPAESAGQGPSAAMTGARLICRGDPI